MTKTKDDGTFKPIKLEDGSIYLATIKKTVNGTVRVLHVNDEIRAAARALLPTAQAMAESTAIRSAFYKYEHPQRSTQVAKDAQIAAAAAEQRASIIFHLANGESEWVGGFVDVSSWGEILRFFHQTPGVGSIKV